MAKTLQNGSALKRFVQERHVEKPLDTTAYCAPVLVKIKKQYGTVGPQQRAIGNQTPPERRTATTSGVAPAAQEKPPKRGWGGRRQWHGVNTHCGSLTGSSRASVIPSMTLNCLLGHSRTEDSPVMAVSTPIALVEVLL